MTQLSATKQYKTIAHKRWISAYRTLGRRDVSWLDPPTQAIFQLFADHIADINTSSVIMLLQHELDFYRNERLRRSVVDQRRVRRCSLGCGPRKSEVGIRPPTAPSARADNSTVGFQLTMPYLLQDIGQKTLRSIAFLAIYLSGFTLLAPTC